MSEKESLWKSFLLFFATIEFFLLFIFYQYSRIEEEHLREGIFLEMKNYSLFFEDKRFETAVIPSSTHYKPYELYEDTNALFMLLPTPTHSTEQLKIRYPKSLYLPQLQSLQSSILLQLLLLSLVALLISMLFALYTLSPMRRSLRLLETFIRDIIHDLNTPLTSILISLKMLDGKNKEIETISSSAKAISMLQHNLDNYLRGMQCQQERFDLKELIDEQLAFFVPQYDYLRWEAPVTPCLLYSDRYAFSRILYNLISNACKYNTAEGDILIQNTGSSLTISNSSYGIKEPSRIFDRFYKEHERGLGIGLHIVAKLCEQLQISKTLTVKEKQVSITLDLSRIMHAPEVTEG